MKVTTLVPTSRNDGTPVSDTEMDRLLSRFVAAFGGVSAEGETQGTWVHEGRTYNDLCRRVVVHTDAERWPEVLDLIVEIGAQLGQEAMWVEVQYFDGVRIVPIRK